MQNQDYSPVVCSLLDTLVNAGLKITEIECDGEHHKPAPKFQDAVVKLTCEARMTDFGLQGPTEREKYWLRVVLDNEPWEIVNDYTDTTILNSLIENWSDSWEECIWFPRQAK